MDKDQTKIITTDSGEKAIVTTKVVESDPLTSYQIQHLLDGISSSITLAKEKVNGAQADLDSLQAEYNKLLNLKSTLDTVIQSVENNPQSEAIQVNSDSLQEQQIN